MTRGAWHYFVSCCVARARVSRRARGGRATDDPETASESARDPRGVTEWGPARPPTRRGSGSFPCGPIGDAQRYGSAPLCPNLAQ
jgi:hypothetical protein